MISRKLAGFTLFILSFVLLSGFTFAQDAVSKKDFAEILNQGSSVAWSINTSNKSVSVSVSAPNGDVYRQDFPAGSTPVFSIPSRTDSFDGSGTYNFEIVVTPVLSKGAEEMIRGARRDGSDQDLEDTMRKQGLIPEALIQTGSFRVIDGQIVTKNDLAVDSSEAIKRSPEVPETKTPTPPKAGDTDVPTDDVQVITMDLVVLGSTCIGLDCPNNPSFGFDTLRLQENNLRINFEDTSNTASFPTRDWRIVANDTTNGGLEHFSIDDVDAGRTPFRIEGNAPANSIYLDSSGNVGFKTSTPVVELHSRDGDTPTLRLEQDGSGGFTAQSWDIAGNETNFFVRDVTNGSTLPFRIQPGASNGTLNIGTSGNVGIGFGTNNFSTNPLEIRDNNATQLAIVNTSGELHLPLTGGGVRFPDGTTQTTAAGSGTGDIVSALNVGTGSGFFKQKSGSLLEFKTIKAGANVTVTPTGADEITIASSTAPPLGASFATTIFGGSGDINPISTAAPAFDANSYGTGIAGAAPGQFAILLYDIPGNSNLAVAGGTNVVFKIRYRDSDGAAAAASVTLSKVTINVAGGNRTVDTIFTSTGAGTGFQTVTVCKPANYFDFANLGNHLNVALVSGTGTNADFTLVQVYKTDGACP